MSGLHTGPSRLGRVSAMKRDMPQVSAEAPMTDPTGLPKQIMLNQKDDAKVRVDSVEPET